MLYFYRKGVNLSLRERIPYSLSEISLHEYLFTLKGTDQELQSLGGGNLNFNYALQLVVIKGTLGVLGGSTWGGVKPELLG